jgi:hypothetical protein
LVRSVEFDTKICPAPQNLAPSHICAGLMRKR